VKCSCMQGCCVGARPGVRSWRSIVQVATSTKTYRVGAAARPSSSCNNVGPHYRTNWMDPGSWFI